MKDVRRRLRTVLSQAMDDYSVPGASVGITVGGEQQTLSRGITCSEFPLDVDDDTLFQIGSTTKTFTATALMMLVEEGSVELEAPVQRYLPSFKLRDADATRHATIRHLVTHTGGWRGDYFDDLGRGDDALRRIVRRMATKTPQVTPLGAAWSYNNAGFYVLGRVLEEVSGLRYEDVVRTRIFVPLGMERSFFFPEEVMTYKTAIGHLVTASGEVNVARPFGLTRAANPAGGIVSTVKDQLRYARFHLEGGRTGDGTRLLKAATVKAMQRELAEAGSMADAVGVSWLLERVGGARIVKHGGSVNGHMSEFLMVPARKLAVTVLTNGSRGHELGRVVLDWVLAELAGLRRPAPVFVPLDADQARAYIGRYPVSPLAEYHLTAEDDGLLVTLVATAKGRASSPDLEKTFPPPMPLGMVGPDRGRVRGPFNEGARVEFLRGGDGQVAFMRSGGRLYPRKAPRR